MKFFKNQKECINHSIEKNQLERECKWSESIAVGSEDFVTRIKDRLNVRAKARRIAKTQDDFILSETEFSYRPIFDAKNDTLSSKNDYF